MLLIEHLTQKTYSHTHHQIVAYAKETFGLEYTVSGMSKSLHHNGLLKTKLQAFIEDCEAIEASFGKDKSIAFIGS